MWERNVSTWAVDIFSCCNQCKILCLPTFAAFFRIFFNFRGILEQLYLGSFLEGDLKEPQRLEVESRAVLAN